MSDKVVTFPGVRVETAENAHVFREEKDKPKRNLCRYCREGNTPNERGQHWIVKSVVPARMDIRDCKNFLKSEAKP